jgi:hypothetical protein
MCIVVDANVAHKMRADDPDGSPVLKWLLKGGGRLVVCNELLGEISDRKFLSTLVVLEQAGRLCRAEEDRVKAEKYIIENSGLMKSNDPHILATVRVSRCELVFSHDQPLHADLKNGKLIGSCSIYQNASHGALLGQCRC